MTYINFEVSGYSERVLDSMLKRGYAKKKTEAIRLALFEFDRIHALTEDQAYAKAAADISDRIKSGQLKTRKLSPSELD